MSTIFDRVRPSAQTHALIIGAGNFPYCAPARSEPAGPFDELARQLTALTSPQISAHALAVWLIDELADDEVAPLGSVELLVSAGPAHTPAVGGHVPGAPTFDAVKAAVRRWQSRCDMNEHNVAMFYFAGHGLGKGNQLILPLEDVGRDRHLFFENAILLDHLIQGMTAHRAAIQCYYIEACRTTPYEFASFADLGIRPLLPVPDAVQEKDTVVVHSTKHGAPAFAEPGQVTAFTQALMLALGGLAANRFTGRGPWKVTTDRIGPTINRLLQWQGNAGPHLQMVPTIAPILGGTVRRLRSAPEVPFRLSCKPDAALECAELSLVQLRSRVVGASRAPAPALWEGRARADHYEMHARFAKEEYPDSWDDVHVQPPHFDHDLVIGG